jgi:hypothetical protein
VKEDGMSQVLGTFISKSVLVRFASTPRGSCTRPQPEYVTEWKFQIDGTWSTGKDNPPFLSITGTLGVGEKAGVESVRVPDKDRENKDLPEDMAQEDVIGSIVGRFSDILMSQQRNIQEVLLKGIDATEFPNVEAVIKIAVVKKVLVRLKIERTVTTENAGR